MPEVEVADLTIHYQEEGGGEPLLLLPYTGADHACYAFQLPAYAQEFRCISVDLPGTGLSSKPAGPYATEIYADVMAGFLDALGIESAHVAGVSLGAAVGTHLAAQHPGRVRSLSLHSAWTTTDRYLQTLLEGWMELARSLPTVADAVILGIFPWCFTPEFYAQRPDDLGALEDFVRGRPAQPLESFLAQCRAAIDHDAAEVLGHIRAPTLVTFGGRDLCTSTRFADAFTDALAHSHVRVFGHLSHAGLHEDPETFNAVTLDFLKLHRAT